MQNRKNIKKLISKSKTELNKKPAVKVVPVNHDDDITVIIVDKQFDFDNQEGSLYVKGGENLNKPIINYVKNNQKKISQIIFTRDWHTSKDKSFSVNGGQWPNHCEQGTPGAQINKELYDELSKFGITINIFDKGTDPNHEEYGAFEQCTTFHHLHPNDKPSVKNCYFKNFDSSSGVRIINENLVICGIAGDYCVKETILTLIKHWRKFKISVLMDGVASIDDGTTLNEVIESNNLQKVYGIVH